MLSKEEIEQARSNILRGNDIESACLIMKAMIWDGLIQAGGRVNIAKIAMRQILNFIEEYKNKNYLDVVREKVKANNRANELETNNKKLIKKLEGDIKILGNYEERKQMSKEQLFENDAKWFYAAEILEFAKGEKK